MSIYRVSIVRKERIRDKLIEQGLNLRWASYYAGLSTLEMPLEGKPRKADEKH